MGSISKRLDRIEAVLRQRQTDEDQPYDLFATIARTAAALAAIDRGEPLPADLTDEDRRSIIESREIVRNLEQAAVHRRG